VPDQSSQDSIWSVADLELSRGMTLGNEFPEDFGFESSFADQHTSEFAAGSLEFHF
jgi:hypothetical protein